MSLDAPLEAFSPSTRRAAAAEPHAALRFARALCGNELFRRAAIRVMESRVRACASSALWRGPTSVAEERQTVALALLQSVERALGDGRSSDALWFALALALPRRAGPQLWPGHLSDGGREGGRERL